MHKGRWCTKNNKTTAGPQSARTSTEPRRRMTALRHPPPVVGSTVDCRHFGANRRQFTESDHQKPPAVPSDGKQRVIPLFFGPDQDELAYPAFFFLTRDRSSTKCPLRVHIAGHGSVSDRANFGYGFGILLTRWYSRQTSQNQCSELSSSTMIPQMTVVAGLTRSED